MKVPRQWVAATQSGNKLLELQQVAARLGYAIISPADAQRLLSLSSPPVVDETGESYLENAALKARAYSSWSGLPALGDDSGLEVRALEGRPGLYSARYAGPNAGDSQRIEKILTEVREVESRLGVRDRAAHFRCSLVLRLVDGQEYHAEATLEGEVLDGPRGTGGFGYDPIVLIHSLGATLAEVDFAVTCQRGFRAKALESLVERLS